MKEVKEKLSYVGARGSPTEQWLWRGRSPRSWGHPCLWSLDVLVTPGCPHPPSLA